MMEGSVKIITADPVGPKSYESGPGTLVLTKAHAAGC
jgi:hypothetical protein